MGQYRLSIVTKIQLRNNSKKWTYSPLLIQVCMYVHCHLRPHSLCLIHQSPFCPTGSTRCQLQLGNRRTWWIPGQLGRRKFGPMWKAPYIFTLVLFSHTFLHSFFEPWLIVIFLSHGWSCVHLIWKTVVVLYFLSLAAWHECQQTVRVGKTLARYVTGQTKLTRTK